MSRLCLKLINPFATREEIDKSVDQDQSVSLDQVHNVAFNQAFTVWPKLTRLGVSDQRTTVAANPVGLGGSSF